MSATNTLLKREGRSRFSFYFFFHQFWILNPSGLTLNPPLRKSPNFTSNVINTVLKKEMKKLAIVFLLIICVKSFGQKTETKDLVDHVLTTEVLKDYQYAIAIKIDSVLFDFMLNTFVNANNKKYESILNRKLKIRLSRKEKEYLVKEVKKLYAENWKVSDFKNPVLTLEEIKPYLEKSRRNSIVYITKPILFRNNNVA
jgi:hypothetical protein